MFSTMNGFSVKVIAFLLHFSKTFGFLSSQTPADKLRCIHRCCIAIMNLLSMATPSHTSGADEFVPVLVYVLIRANPPHLLSTKQYINNFIDDRLSGEEMYCWTQFSAAVEFVKSLR